MKRVRKVIRLCCAFGLLLGLAETRCIAQLELESKSLQLRRTVLTGLVWDENGGALTVQLDSDRGMWRLESIGPDFNTRWAIETKKAQSIAFRKEVDPLSDALRNPWGFQPTTRFHLQGGSWVLVNRYLGNGTTYLAVAKIDTAGKWYEGRRWNLKQLLPRTNDLDFWMGDTLALVHAMPRGFLFNFVGLDSLSRLGNLEVEFDDAKTHSRQFIGCYGRRLFFLKARRDWDNPSTAVCELVALDLNGGAQNRYPIEMELPESSSLLLTHSQKQWTSQPPLEQAQTPVQGWIDPKRGELWLYGLYVDRRKRDRKNPTAFLVRCDTSGKPLKTCRHAFTLFSGRGSAVQSGSAPLKIELERSLDSSKMLLTLVGFTTHRQQLVFDDSLNLVQSIWPGLDRVATLRREFSLRQHSISRTFEANLSGGFFEEGLRQHYAPPPGARLLRDFKLETGQQFNFCPWPSIDRCAVYNPSKRRLDFWRKAE